MFLMYHEPHAQDYESIQEDRKNTSGDGNECLQTEANEHFTRAGL